MSPGDHSAVYEILIKGELDERWLRWFDGLSISYQPDGITSITGIMDHAALHGVLDRILDLDLCLISVQRSPMAQED